MITSYGMMHECVSTERQAVLTKADGFCIAVHAKIGCIYNEGTELTA